MSRLTVRFPFVLVAVLALVLFTSAAPVFADPSFGNVSDILGGRRTLFRDDDLLFTQYPPNNDVTVTILQTQDDQINNQIEYTVSGPSNFVTATPRMFDLPRDIQLTIVAGAAMVNDEASSSNFYFPNNLGGHGVAQGVYAQGDLTGDGYEDVAFIENGNVNVVTANDVNTLNAGLFYATPIPLPPGDEGLEYGLAIADFDADGVTELALAAVVLNFNSSQVQIEIYKPQVTVNGNGSIASLAFNNIGSTSISIENQGEVNRLRLTAGAFSGAANPNNQLPYRQLAALYQTETENPLTLNTYLAAINVTQSQNPPQDDVTVANNFLWQASAPGIAGFESDYLDFFSNTEQLVILSYPENAITALDVFTLDGNLNFVPASSHLLPLTVPVGLALGNFDQPNTGSSPLVLEAAVLTANLDASDCQPGLEVGLVVTFFHFDPNNAYNISTNYSKRLNTKCHPIDDPNTAVTTLVAGDTQGRSLFVGAPTVMTVNHTQPHLVLSAPPMHVDYASPVNGGAPQVINVSAVPKRFYSQYSTDVTNANQSTHQGTTSFTNAASISTTVGYQWGGSATGSITVKAGDSLGFMNSRYTTKQYGTYSAQDFDASTGTGFDDQVWLDIQTHYIYAFPVIGQYICSNQQPTCPSSDLVPLLVLISGPMITEVETVTASGVEWYQPVHQQGSVFTYPWNFTQLQNAEGGSIDLLTPQKPQGFSTDDSSTSESVTWKGQNRNSVTSGSATNVNWSAYLSVSSKPGITGGTLASLNVQYSGSTAISTLNTSINNIGKSTGFGIIKPNTLTGDYAYSIFPFIYGDKPVTGTFQTNVLTSTVQTSGILRTGFTVNLYDLTASPWWQETYTLPDVALAHPTQWSFPSVPYQTLAPNCITIGIGIAQCAELNPITDDFTTDNFLAMKGLMITPAGANGQGPQLSGATAGDQIRLQARVYNYSLADMPDRSQIVVQFYGQPFDETTKKPNGNAFLIDNVSVPGLPGFDSQNSGGANPNWTLASTLFDTTPYSDQNIVFWVVVVLKDAQGNPLPEMPEHGLTGVPPTLNSVAESKDWMQTYSNNVGLYQYLFYIAPKTNALAPAGANVSGANRLRIDPIRLTKKRVLLNRRVTITANVHAERDRDDVAALIYAASPGGESKAFEYEGISHIRGGSFYQVRANYTPDECGTHEIRVQVIPDGATAKTTLQVTIKHRAYVRQLLKYFEQLGLKGRAGGGLVELLQSADKAFKNKDNKAGVDAIGKFQERVQALRGDRIPRGDVNWMLGIAGLISRCVKT